MRGTSNCTIARAYQDALRGRLRRDIVNVERIHWRRRVHRNPVPSQWREGLARRVRVLLHEVAGLHTGAVGGDAFLEGFGDRLGPCCVQLPHDLYPPLRDLRHSLLVESVVR